MKKKTEDQRDWHEKRIEEVKKGGAPESAASRATFPKRTRKPGQAGLANEPRPGLGSRADEVDPNEMPQTPPANESTDAKPEATKLGYEEPRPEPREQPSDSLAHEQERSTGVSGHTGNT